MLVLVDGLQAGNRSGTGTYTAALARWLPEVAHELEIRILWPAQAAAPPGCEEAVFLRCALPRFAGRVMASQFGVQRMAKKLGASLIHYPATIGGLLPRQTPSIITVHDLSFYHHPEWFRFERAWYYRVATASSTRHAARLIADSEATAQDIERFLGISRERIDVIHLAPHEEMGRPMSTAAVESARIKYRLPQRFFLYLGTLEPRKNLIRLIHAYAETAAKHPFDLVLAGRDGWKQKGIYAAARAVPCAPRIHFPGYIEKEDVPALYAASGAFVYPSLFEGFGLPVADALAAGLPVITARSSSLPEVAGNAALYVEPEDPHGLADALEQLANDEELRTELAARGRAWSAQFSWRHTAEKTIQAYRQTIAAHTIG